MSRHETSGPMMWTTIGRLRAPLALALGVLVPAGLPAQQSSEPTHQHASATTPLRATTAYKVRPLGELIPPEGLADTEQHPLAPALQMAMQRYDYIRQHVVDYTCVLAKRERVDGKLMPYEYIQVKCRNERRDGEATTTPFSVYMKFLAPSTVKNREVLYVAGENGGDMLVRKGGRRHAYLEVWLNPSGDQAMRESRYPITEFGIENLVRRLIEVAQDDMQYGECHVRVVDNATLDGRSCTAIQVTHPVRRDHFRFHIARIMIDNELQLPVHYASYDWPATEGGEPALLEEYTFRKLQVNVGLDDADFQRTNPEYGFRKS